MRKVQKILLGIFLGGVLLGGIGTGVALVEYSSLTYGGEKCFGEENMVTREMDYVFLPEEERVDIDREYWIDSLEEDESVPEGTIRYEVTYNEKMVEPCLRFWELDSFESEEQEAEMKEFEETEAGEQETERWEAARQDADEQTREYDQKKALKRTRLEFHVKYVRSDMAVFLECKDEILDALKEKKIYQYNVAYISRLRIKVNPKTMPYVQGNVGARSIFCSSLDN